MVKCREEALKNLVPETAIFHRFGEKYVSYDLDNCCFTVDDWTRGSINVCLDKRGGVGKVEGEVILEGSPYRVVNDDIEETEGWEQKVGSVYGILPQNCVVTDEHLHKEFGFEESTHVHFECEHIKDSASVRKLVLGLLQVAKDEQEEYLGSRKSRRRTPGW